MFGWHLQLNRHEFEQTPGDSEVLMCCCLWGCQELHMIQQLNNSDSTHTSSMCFLSCSPSRYVSSPVIPCQTTLGVEPAQSNESGSLFNCTSFLFTFYSHLSPFPLSNSLSKVPNIIGIASSAKSTSLAPGSPRRLFPSALTWLFLWACTEAALLGWIHPQQRTKFSSLFVHCLVFLSWNVCTAQCHPKKLPYT